MKIEIRSVAGLYPDVFDGCDWSVENGLLWVKNDTEAVAYPLTSVRSFKITASESRET